MESASPARLRGGLAALLVLVLITTVAGPVGAQSTEERRLAENRQRIAEVRQQLEQAAAVRGAQAGELAEAQAQVDVVLDAVMSAEAAVQRQHQAVDTASTRLTELEAAVVEQQRLMAERAVALYQEGGAAPFQELLGADSPADALERSAYLSLVNRGDQRAFEGVEIAQTAVAAQREVLEAEEQVLASVLDEQQLLLADAAAIRDSEALEVARADEQLGQLQAQERHLESESREIAALARRNSERAASRAAAAAAPQPAAAAPQSAPATTPSGSGAEAQTVAAPVSAGGWTWPSSGPVTSGYGRRWGRTHEGIDIGAPSGAPVVAARSGVVSYAGRMGGYGNMILVDHGGGIVTAYAHLSRIQSSVGTGVSGGQRIGLVGSTGNSTGPHLHFEVRVNGAPRNPRNYLP